MHSRPPCRRAPSALNTTYGAAEPYASGLWNCLWISILLSFSKSFASARADHSLLLPSAADATSAATCLMPDQSLYYWPVIGILSHPGDGASGRLNNATDASYIAASYVKFVESAGARVIPLIYNEPMETLAEKLELVNGVLFTGGRVKDGLYYNVARDIFKMTLAKNDAGDHFPLLAICLGFELLSMIISEDKNILERFSANDQASTLEFTRNVILDGTVFQSDEKRLFVDRKITFPLKFPPELLRKLSTECLVMQNHHYGISPERFAQYSALSNFFKILTTSTDEHSKVYVSTVQAQNYPVTGFQWHPEKNAFEWGSSMIPHSDDAIQVTQNVANFFIREARKSSNRPSSHKVLDNLIYNYSPTYCGKAGKGYDEVYIFT